MLPLALKLITSQYQYFIFISPDALEEAGNVREVSFASWFEEFWQWRLRREGRGTPFLHLWCPEFGEGLFGSNSLCLWKEAGTREISLFLVTDQPDFISKRLHHWARRGISDWDYINVSLKVLVVYCLATMTPGCLDFDVKYDLYGHGIRWHIAKTLNV